MIYKTLGKNGPRLSIIGIGAWQAGFKLWGSGYTRDDIIDAYRYAFDNGVNFIDTAELYGDGYSEKIVGEAIKEYPDVIVATKLAGYNASEKSIYKSIRKSLERIGRNIDIYQIHWPPPIYRNLCRVMKTLEKMVDEGYIRYIGVSNFTLNLLERARECLSKYDVISNQIQYNLVYRVHEKNLIPYMNREGIGLIAYSPLARGALAGRKKPRSAAQKTSNIFIRGASDAGLRNILEAISKKYEVDLAAVSLRWLIDKGAFPIPGVKNKRHVDVILEAIKLKLDHSDMLLLDRYTMKYIEGRELFNLMRFIPGFIQKLSIKLMGGV